MLFGPREAKAPHASLPPEVPIWLLPLVWPQPFLVSLRTFKKEQDKFNLRFWHPRIVHSIVFSNIRSLQLIRPDVSRNLPVERINHPMARQV